jgi:hypothetical protein
MRLLRCYEDGVRMLRPGPEIEDVDALAKAAVNLFSGDFN